MVKLVGFEKSTFDAEKYRQAVNGGHDQNIHGQTLTTEGIRAGIAMMQKGIENGANDWLLAMKETPAYISSSNQTPPDSGD